MKLVKTFGESGGIAASMIDGIERRGAVNTARVGAVVASILSDVQQRGDVALTHYASQFDALQPGQALRVTAQEMEAAWAATPPHLQAAMQVARENIRSFAERQMPTAWTISPAEGVRTGQMVRPLASVGCYVPGGRYPLPSTLLMTVTPAHVAGVGRIVVCSPMPARETLAAAFLAGVSEFYRVGGAQAIAALAYGTGSIARVEKIVGPGNLYVTAAKIAVMQDCGVDMPAGPTEIGIMSVDGEPSGIAADLVAQAEHDPDALAVLITPNEALACSVLAEIDAQAQQILPAHAALEEHGFIFVTETVTEARLLTNRLAFEHLSVDTWGDLEWIRAAGSVFVGRYSPQSMGDYVSGPNHVLPTGRAGRVRGGLSVLDFVKIITVQEYSREGLAKLGPHTIALAEAEGLLGHAQSVRVKLAGGTK